MDSASKQSMHTVYHPVPSIAIKPIRRLSKSLREWKTPSESFTDSEFSDSDSDSGVKVPPRSFKAFADRQSGPLPVQRRSRTQFYQPLSLESHEPPSFTVTNPATPSLSSLRSFALADSGTLPTFPRKGMFNTSSYCLETTETTESRRSSPARKIILCMSKREGKHTNSVLECISEIRADESRGTNSRKPRRLFVSTGYLRQPAKLSLKGRKRYQRMTSWNERSESKEQRFWRRKSVIKESVEEHMLTEYWMQKDELDEKYDKLLNSLEFEEAAEIKLRTRKVLAQGGKVDAAIIMDIIDRIKEEYDITRSLLVKQKIQVVEELIDQCHKKLAK